MLVDERAFELLVARATRAAITEALAPLLQAERPADLELMSVREVAHNLACTSEHVLRLIEAGELGESYDIRTEGATRATRRVARVAVAAYLERRREQHRLAPLRAVR
jgi:excisionase family DNA binding protein